MSHADNGAFHLRAGEGRRIWAFRFGTTALGPEPRWTPPGVRPS
ncbi:MAG TPA: hypothetical protein VFL03_04215 [Candidatus Limnocylindrales bacterium]|nr:hypothetical protein [Candidatus Limnocylindrales bacterium]